MKLTFDLETMTLGEVETFEELTGLDISDMGGKLPAKALSALVYIQERRTNPGYTIEDARAIRVSEFEIDEPDPTPAGDAS